MHPLKHRATTTLIFLSLLTFGTGCAANSAETSTNRRMATQTTANDRTATSTVTNGRTVTYAEFGYGEEHLGAFRQVGPTAWREVSATVRNSFDFVETGRD